MEMARFNAARDRLALAMRVLIVAAFLVPGFIGLNRAYFVDLHPEQDQCQFGDITNEDYRALRARAAQQSSAKWSRLGGSEDEVSNGLIQRINELAGDSPGIYRQLAAMHAVMRQLNAHLGSDRHTFYASWTSAEPPEDQKALSFTYSVPSLSLSKFGLMTVDERAFPSVLINWRAQDLQFYRAARDGDLRVAVRFRDWVSDFLKGPEPALSSTVSCLPIPPPEWARRFDDWRRRQSRSSR
jgi:hypothetical protein